MLLTTIQHRPWVLLFFPHSITLVTAEMEKLGERPTIEMNFMGTGSEETRPSTVEDGWKIQWETESPLFKLSAHGSSRRLYVGGTTEREEVLRWFERLEPIVLANTTKKKGSSRPSPRRNLLF